MTSILRKSEKIYYNELLNKHKNDVKFTWKILNEIMRKSHLTSNYPETFDYNGNILRKTGDIANGFNQFFTNVGPSLARNIPNIREGNVCDYLFNRNEHSMFLTEVTDNEVINLVKNCKSKTSKDCEDISMILLKRVINSIVSPLTDIFNKSFIQGIFPENMKIAKVVPLYKNGNKNIFTNYRPVSLLPQFSKILEKLFNKRLLSFIDKYDILSESQYGFRKNRSTSLALWEFVENISNSLDNKKHTIGVYIDLKKAFDTIDHGLLIKKLEFYGIRGIASNWLYTYLNKRQQYVQFDNKASSLLEIKCGVPQGSVLGPQLFILYINDICNVSKIVHFILFADDTNLFVNGDNIDELCLILNRELDKLNTWFIINKLSLNVSKTNYMIFSYKAISNNICIKFNCSSIERVRVTKFLGIWIDDKLNWKEHITRIKNKLSKSIAIMHKSKHLLDNQSLYILYCSLILPYLNYCLEIWGNTYKSNLNSLYILQKRAIRIICKVDSRAHTKELFYKLKILNLYDLLELRICTLLYKAKYFLLPQNLQDMFTLQTNHKYNTRQNIDFKVNHARTNIKAMSITIKGVKLWNSLGSDLTKSVSLKIFVKNFKKKVVEMYSNV